MTKRRRVRLMAKGKTQAFVSESSTGLVAGTPGLQQGPGEIHITAVVHDGQVDLHKTKTGPGGKQYQRLGPVTESQKSWLRRKIRETTIPWDPALEVYVPDDSILANLAAQKRKVGELSPSLVHSPEFLPLTRPNLDDNELWTRTTLGQLDAGNTPFAVMKEGEEIFWLILSPGTRIAKLRPESLFDELQEWLAISGVDSLLADYE